MICVKKEIETHNGLFRIGAVVLNEDETWKDDNVKPVSFRIDLDNLQWLQSEGVKGYQKKMNGVIRWARQNGCPLPQM